MALYGKILLYAMPAFLIAVLFEKGYGLWRGQDTYRTMDMISSLSSGITNVVKDVLGLSISIITYAWMVKHLAIYHIENSVLTFLIAFIVMDFQGYWVHRWAHEINLFWNKHAIHHSSEDFNLACALRQSISSFVNLFTFFLLPAAILGVPKETIAIVAPVHLFAQFWYHTQHIRRMGFLEHIIVTPAHHRVHHAVNKVYMDKNYSQIFIVWDKWFGTFQDELPEEPPVYGISRPAATWNPIKINFQHLWLLIKDAWRANSLWDKCRIWFMPTGWRPADVAAKYPVPKIDDPYTYEKYQTQSTKLLRVWAWLQFAMTVFFVFYFFGNLGQIGTPDIFVYGAFLFAQIYALTELMDRNPFALAYEFLKNAFAISWIWMTGDWFGVSGILPLGSTIVIAYALLSTVVTAAFVFGDIMKDTGTTKSYSFEKRLPQ
jgi:sterol desaturase/sphingolipid hydroxylase (fatty acid hydroxylase superfamily)